MMNILIPTDFSENSHNAIRYALEFFADVPVNFHILHVSKKTALYPEEEKDFSETTSEINTIENSSALLKSEIKMCRLCAKNPSHNFLSINEELNLIEAIRKYVAKNEIDYILMGTKGASKINRDEIGSNTWDVITKVKCPVFIVPENAKFKGNKYIAFLTDYNSIYRNKVISTLSEVLSLHLASLRVLHIKSKTQGLTAFQTDNKGFLHYFFKETKHSFHFIDNKDLETGIQDFVETWEISLVSIVAKNLNFIQRLLLRPAVKTFSYQNDIPFLVLHE